MEIYKFVDCPLAYIIKHHAKFQCDFLPNSKIVLENHLVNKNLWLTIYQKEQTNVEQRDYNSNNVDAGCPDTGHAAEDDSTTTDVMLI